MKNSILWSLAVALAFNLPAYGQEQPTEPVGGKPPAGAKPSNTDLDYQVKYQRAFEAVIWSMPAVGIYGFQRGFTDIGGTANVMVAYSKPAKPNLDTFVSLLETEVIANDSFIPPAVPLRIFSVTDENRFLRSIILLV